MDLVEALGKELPVFVELVGLGQAADEALDRTAGIRVGAMLANDDELFAGILQDFALLEQVEGRSGQFLVFEPYFVLQFGFEDELNFFLGFFYLLLLYLLLPLMGQGEVFLFPGKAPPGQGD